jgi:hypothetical protein
MASGRASIFEEPEELDVSGFAPKGPPSIAAPPAAQVRAVSEAAKFPSREAQTRPPVPAPKREPRRYRTGRNVQFNMKASQKAVEAFYAISDNQGWVLGETLEHAVAALQRELSSKSRAGDS